MDYVSNEAKVSAGEAVLTSGQDRIFPKDLPVATVTETAADRKGSFMKILLTPAAHLDRLEEVLVLLTRQDMDVKKEAETSPPASPVSKTPAGTR